MCKQGECKQVVSSGWRSDLTGFGVVYKYVLMNDLVGEHLG